MKRREGTRALLCSMELPSNLVALDINARFSICLNCLVGDVSNCPRVTTAFRMHNMSVHPPIISAEGEGWYPHRLSRCSSLSTRGRSPMAGARHAAVTSMHLEELGAVSLTEGCWRAMHGCEKYTRAYTTCIPMSCRCDTGTSTVMKPGNVKEELRDRKNSLGSPSKCRDTSASQCRMTAGVEGVCIWNHYP